MVKGATAQSQSDSFSNGGTNKKYEVVMKQRFDDIRRKLDDDLKNCMSQLDEKIARKRRRTEEHSVINSSMQTKIAALNKEKEQLAVEVQKLK